MTAEHIEAKFLRLDHHVPHELHRSWRVYGFRIEILIKRGDHVEGLPVQEQLTIARFEKAESETSTPPVLNRPLQRHLYCVQRRSIWRPGTPICDRAHNAYVLRTI